MAPKRPMGLGKSAKAKKQKKEEESSTDGAPSNEITVELSETADANDELAQLIALWNTYQTSEKENELVLNGIVHECDRLLRNSFESTDEKLKNLPDYFHSIYALALADLELFNVEEKKDAKRGDFYLSASERIDLGMEKYPKSPSLLFAKSRIEINHIPLAYISKMATHSSTKKFPNVSKLLDEVLKTYEEAENLIIKQKSHYDLFNEENFEFLEALDDLLDMVDNFGQDDALDSDAEDDEQEEIVLSKNHPLYDIKHSDKYNQWWRDHIIIFLENLDKDKGSKDSSDTKKSLRREICKRIGQSYLQESEGPVSIFTTLVYDSDNEEEEIQGLSAEKAQGISIELVTKAIEYLKQAEDSEEPQTWVDIAEALITLGNTYDNESKEQERTYKEAEEILRRANNASNGKYDDILQNLLEEKDK